MLGRIPEVLESALPRMPTGGVPTQRPPAVAYFMRAESFSFGTGVRGNLRGQE